MSPERKSLGERIRQGTRWTLASSVVIEAGQFLVGIVLARLLLPADFGLVTTVGVLTGIAGYFAGAGSGQALVRSPEITPRHFHVAFTLQLAACTLIYALIAAVSPWFAAFFGHAIYVHLLLLSGLSFFLRPFSSIPAAALQREMRLRPIAITNVIAVVTSSATSLGMALVGLGPWSLVGGGIAGGIARAIALNAYVRVGYRLAWDRVLAGELGGYGARVAANALVEHFRASSLILIISKLTGPTDVGIFNRSLSLAQLPMRTVGRAPYQAIFRALAAESANLDRSRYIYYRTTSLMMVYTLPLYAFLWWLAEPGIRFVYGEKWGAVAEPLRILATAGLLRCLMNPSGAIIEARNRVTTEIVINTIGWILLVVLAVALRGLGLSGFALASVLTTLFLATSLAVVVQREIRGTTRALLAAILPAVTLNAILLATLALADWAVLFGLRAFPGLYVIASTAIGGFVYLFAFMYLPFGSLKSEAERWRKRLRLTRRDPP